MHHALTHALRAFAQAPPDAGPDAPLALLRAWRGSGLIPGDCVAEVVAQLAADPALAEGVAGALSALLASRRHRYLYAEAGVPEPMGFGRTLRTRIGARLLPHAPQLALLRDLVSTVFQDAADIAWVRAVPPAQWTALFEELLAAPALAAGRAQAGGECDAALGLLAARAAGLAADPDRLRYQRRVRRDVAVAAAAPAIDDADLDGSEALALPAAVQAWTAACEARAADASARPRELLRAIAACEAEVQQLRDAATTAGTSIALNHSLHAAGQTLLRMRQLVLVRAGGDPAQQAARAAALFVELVTAQESELHLRGVFGRAVDDVAQQITEHASRTGEHYVTDDRRQWWAMLRAAAGAGLIVGAMALLKVFIVRAHLPPLWETLGICLNYGLGFVVIHLLHFTVATKQPAMTATLLAARLGQEEASPAGAARLADLIVCTVRTQVVAIVGNVGLAVPTAAAIWFAFQALAGASPVPAPKALHMLAELNPWASLALPHAAIAGVCLFFAGVISGYYDNLCVFGCVGDRLARHPVLRRLLGVPRAARLAAYVDGNLGALLGNLAFGFLLGGVGFIGFLTGLPLDIRHVAFASANTAYALLTLDGQVPVATALVTVLGVLLVATTNVAVSFALAFLTAFRARHVQYQRAGLVLQLVLRRLLRRPQDFFWPPGSGSDAQ